MRVLTVYWRSGEDRPHNSFSLGEEGLAFPLEDWLIVKKADGHQAQLALSRIRYWEIHDLDLPSPSPL